MRRAARDDEKINVRVGKKKNHCEDSYSSENQTATQHIITHTKFAHLRTEEQQAEQTVLDTHGAVFARDKVSVTDAEGEESKMFGKDWTGKSSSTCL